MLIGLAEAFFNTNNLYAGISPGGKDAARFFDGEREADYVRTGVLLKRIRFCGDIPYSFTNAL